MLFRSLVYKKKLVADEAAIEEIMNLDEDKAVSDKKLMHISVFMICMVIIHAPGPQPCEARPPQRP